MLGDAFYRLRAQPRPVMLGGAKCSVIFMPQRSREGVVYRYAKRVAGFLCTDNYFSAAFLFRLAGRYCVFYQVAEQDGYIGVGNKNIARYIRLYNIFDTVILCLLRKIQQYGVCSGVFAEAYKRIVRQRVVVAVKVLAHRIDSAAVHVFPHQRHMMPHIMLCPACLGYLFLQVLILYRLHGKLMIFFLQLQRFVLLRNQAGYNIVYQCSSDIDYKQKKGVLGCSAISSDERVAVP